MAENRQDKIQTREFIVDKILEVIIKNGNYILDNHRRFVDKTTGQVIYGRSTPETDNPIVLYQQDYQETKYDQHFNGVVNDVTDCFYNPDTDVYELPSSEPIAGGDFNINNFFVWHDNTPDNHDAAVPSYPSIEFNISLLSAACNPPDLIIDPDTLNQLSQFISFNNIKTYIDVDDAKEILDTTIFELLPNTTSRQSQINKFFNDYANLKPPFPPLFDSEGNITNETAFDYDDYNEAGSNPWGSVSNNKHNGYITRLEEYADFDNENKSLEWLRDDLTEYLRDLDSYRLTFGDIEDNRPEYTKKSKGYLKIRNLNQSIIIRNEENDDIGLIGPDSDNPVWERDGFTISMWVKFKDKVNGGTLFNFGNPFRNRNPKGFTLETFVLHKDDILTHNNDDDTFENWINTSEAFDNDHDFFKKDDYERFVRLVVREPDGSLIDSHVGTSRSYDGYLSKRINTSVFGYNYIPTLKGKTLGDARNSIINWVSEGYSWLEDTYEEFGGDGSFWPRKLLNYERIPIDLNEWYFIVATYDPSIIEYGDPDINVDDFIIGCQDETGESVNVGSPEECCEAGTGIWENGICTDGDYTWNSEIDWQSYQMSQYGAGSFLYDTFISYGPDAANTLRYYSDFWRGDVIPGIQDGNGGCLSGRLATAEEYGNNDTLAPQNCGGFPCCVGVHTHHSGYGAKCKVEIISRSDLLRARGYKESVE